ncbi:MAG: T9SS type A sorting domain-containing protein [Bacteroidales bacterium]|nr:T9SS type A sorting domain-containing protein [Bacteroidales bacterium]
MKRQLLALAMGVCAISMSAQNAPAQTAKDLVVDKSHEVVGIQHFQDITFNLNGNQPIQGITLSAEGEPKIFTHGHYIVNQNVTPEEAAKGICSWLAFPTDMQTSADSYESLWTAYRYNPSKEFSEAWEKVTPVNGRIVLKANTGYQIRYNSHLATTLTIQFKSITHNFGSNDCRSTGLNRRYNAYNSNSEFANLQLTGTPFMSATRLNTTDIRLAFPNAQGGYDQYVSTDNATPDMMPFQAFFIQHTGNVLYKGINNTNLEMGPVTAHTIGDEFLNIYLNSNNGSDRMVLWFSENGSSTYAAEEDFSKLISGNENYATVYSIENGHRLAYNKTAYTKSIIPVGIVAKQKGTYTFSLNGNATSAAKVVLHDKQRNTYTDLKQRNYTFTASAGELNTRFELSIDFAPNTTTTIENNNLNTTLNVFTSDRGIVVEGVPEGATIKLVDAAGKTITNTYTNGETITLPQLIPGIYMLMINHDNETSAHKLTVK